jgi:hypothetical protein
VLNLHGRSILCMFVSLEQFLRVLVELRDDAALVWCNGI